MTLLCKVFKTVIFDINRYRDTIKIANAAANTYDLITNGRLNSGSYQCKVVSNKFGTSELSNAIIAS